MGSRRLIEWGLVTLVVMALLAAFEYQARSVRSQSERAAVLTTLGVLRTALVLSHVQRQVTGKQDEVNRPPPQNPFLLLEAVPTNFAGAHSMARVDDMPLGAWVFDGACGCVGYRVLHSDALDVPEGAAALWFRVGGPAGALLITPLTRYVWQGQVVG